MYDLKAYVPKENVTSALPFLGLLSAGEVSCVVSTLKQLHGDVHVVRD